MKVAERNLGGWDDLAFNVANVKLAQVFRRELIRRDGKQWYFETYLTGRSPREYFDDPLKAMEAAEKAIVEHIYDLRDQLLSRQTQER